MWPCQPRFILRWVSLLLAIVSVGAFRLGALRVSQTVARFSLGGSVAGEGWERCSARRAVCSNVIMADDVPQARSKDPAAAGTTTLEREERDQSIEEILRQLESIQQVQPAQRSGGLPREKKIICRLVAQGNPKNIVILGTRHCTFLHQQIVELLSYALVLSGNHVYTSGAAGTHTAVVRGALRAEDQSLLTVILPQTIDRQPAETRELLTKVEQVVELGHNEMPLSYASRLCNSELLTKVLIAL